MSTKICLPITESTMEAVFSEAKLLIAEVPHLVELRSDFLDYIEDVSKVVETVKELKSIIGDVGLIFTYRSKSQGGEGSLEPKKVAALLNAVAASGYVDYVDVELRFFDNPKEVIDSIHSKNVKTIASHHEFSRTPKKKEMREVLDEMKAKGATYCKLAVMPRTEVDVLKLMKVSAEFKADNPNQGLITMSMGSLGALSRMGCYLTGSEVTFATRKKASAPGQIEINKLKDILEVLEG